jgi:hypothetical protein
MANYQQRAAQEQHLYPATRVVRVTFHLDAGQILHFPRLWLRLGEGKSELIIDLFLEET